MSTQAALEFRTVRVKEVLPQTPDTDTLRLDTYFDYKPGQFIQVMASDTSTKRSYSFSSSPTEKDHVDITVKAEAGGNVSVKLVKQVEAGDELQVRGPMGRFSLPEPWPKNLCFIAGGSGVAPFRSMNKYLLDRKAQVQSSLFYSAQTPQDFIFHNELTAWSHAGSNFHYVPTTSREFSGSWSGERGHINEAMLHKHLPSLDATFLLCGPPPFVKAMEDLLRGPMAVDPDRIRKEQW